MHKGFNVIFLRNLIMLFLQRTTVLLFVITNDLTQVGSAGAALGSRMTLLYTILSSMSVSSLSLVSTPVYINRLSTNLNLGRHLPLCPLTLTGFQRITNIFTKFYRQKYYWGTKNFASNLVNVLTARSKYSVNLFRQRAKYNLPQIYRCRPGVYQQKKLEP